MADAALCPFKLKMIIKMNLEPKHKNFMDPLQIKEHAYLNLLKFETPDSKAKVNLLISFSCFSKSHIGNHDSKPSVNRVGVCKQT